MSAAPVSEGSRVSVNLKVSLRVIVGLVALVVKMTET